MKTMRIKRIIFFLALVLFIFGFSFRSTAGCKSDCGEEYRAEVESCQETHDDPGEVGLLQTCIDDAKRQYESCIDECER